MALKKFARRDVILPAAVFLLTFAAALFSLRLLSLNQEKDERLRAVYAAESTITPCVFPAEPLSGRIGLYQKIYRVGPCAP